MGIGKDPRESRRPPRGCLGPLNARLRFRLSCRWLGDIEGAGAVAYFETPLFGGDNSGTDV